MKVTVVAFGNFTDSDVCKHINGSQKYVSRMSNLFDSINDTVNMNTGCIG